MIQVGIIMGSNSDWPVMQQAAQFLKEFGAGIRSACRLGTPYA